MLRSPVRVRAIAPLALAALALGMPSAAVAETTPAPSPTTSSSGPVSSTPTPSETATPTPDSSTATPESTADPVPSTTESSTTSPSPESTTAPSSPAKTATGTLAAVASKPLPFGGGVASRSLIAGTPSEQAGFAGGYMVRTLAERDDHYTWPGGTFFDGGNTIDAILGLDGAKVGSDGADAAFAYLEQNVGGYTGTDFDSLYAGPAAKALLAAVAHGADPASFGGDLLSTLLDESLGAVEPGRFSDLPVACGFPTCDYSNTIGQALGVIAVGRATGDVPGEAVDYLLAQQCADGGFRGSLAAAGGACTSDLDATSFAAQALVGVGADDEADAALAFLASRQQGSGGLINADGAENSNTTGLAAQAFSAGGWSEELAAAQGFLAGLQLDCGFAASVRGGIAFTAADRATLLSDPKDTAAVDKLLRSTPQATLGLAGGNLLDVTADGAAATAPTVTCATTKPTATPTSTTPGSTSAGGTNGSGASGGTDGSNVSGPRASGPGLAYTGASPVLPLTIAVLLLLAGAATILVSRRRGAHL